MHQEEPVVFGIEDALCTRYGNNLTADFIPGTACIYTRAFRLINEKHLEPNPYKDPVLVHILKPEFIFEDRILRSLLAESNATFLALQKKRNGKADYKKISRTYRSIIRACLEKLQLEIGNDCGDTDDNENEKYKKFVLIFYSIECIWHLCEIFFMDLTSKNLVVAQLLDWTRFHFPSVERSATDLLLSGREASDSDDYWPTLKGLVMQGNLDIARALLKLHPSAESSAFKTVDQIFTNMPSPITGSGYLKQNSRSKWEYWRTDTERKLTTNILMGEPDLEKLVRIVLGETDTWNAEISKSNCWYEFFAGYLYYMNPACKHFELGNIANDWLMRWGTLNGYRSDNLPLKQLDQIILRLMENDMNQVIHEIQKIGDNQWFVTHLVDLLYHCGQLQILGERQSSHGSVDLRNSLLVEFGSNLMLNHSFWQLGVTYLENCFAEGHSTLEILLPRLSIRSEKMADKIILIARKNGLFNIEQEICKVQARRFFNDRLYGSALEWAIRSKDTIYITSIADFLLQHYSKTGDMLCPDVIVNIGAKMFSSSRLVFLVKYFDFYQYYRKREFLPAAELLVNLLESKITPEYFWASLLIDAIPLLESKDPKIMAKETCAILRNLESEVIPSIEKAKAKLKKNPEESLHILKDYRIENIEEIINLLRLACARNLSRAIIIENTMKSLSNY